MKLSELVEAKAREAATIILEKATNSGNWELEEEQDAITSVADEVQSAIIATLNECGYALMLEAAISKEPLPDSFLDTAEAKLRELEEMSK